MSWSPPNTANPGFTAPLTDVWRPRVAGNEVPVTMICPEFSSEVHRKWIDDDLEPVREPRKISDVSYVDLDTGHWPQLTDPEGLARAIIEGLDPDA